MWVIGGRDGGDNVVTEVDVYDSLRNEWVTLDYGLEIVTLPDNGGGGEEYRVSHQAAFAVDNGAVLVLAGGYTPSYDAVSHVISIDVGASLRSNALAYRVLPSLVHARGGAMKD